MVPPVDSIQLVQITPRTMVFVGDISIVKFKPIYNVSGAPPCSFFYGKAIQPVGSGE